MISRLYWVSDFIFPALLIVIAAFVPSNPVRVVAVSIVLLRALSITYVLLLKAQITIDQKEMFIYTNRNTIFSCSIKIQNHSLMPVHFMTVSVRIGELIAHPSTQFSICIGPKKEHIETFKLESRNRGFYSIGPVEISGTDPFGFFSWIKETTLNQYVIVYPNIFKINRSYKDGLPSGVLKVANLLYEDITNYESIREYIPGDELRRINWKTSARLGKLYTTQYVTAINLPTMILLNLSNNDYPTRNYVYLSERAIEFAASLIFHLIRIGQKVEFETSGKLKREPLTLKAKYHKMESENNINFMKILASIEINDQSLDFTKIITDKPRSLPKGSRLAVISPSISKHHEKNLLFLQKKGFQVELFLVRKPSKSFLELGLKNIPLHYIGEKSKLIL